ncbi:hypothetical protein [Streptococcus oralis]|uniref:Uncharacterized protein n=1 Tax=Streptococcus oralis subsp. oralis TaxID=1891914 RepID=A0A1X1HTR4_STROR|nr:hypothetical protein [Streptococcus oralis]ORO64208.1 hypothetical protein B7714_04865 [Streptococcus oralis subsp. oralis]
MVDSGHSISGSYLGLIFLVSLPSAILAFYINSRKKSFQGLYAPIVFTLFMILMLLFNMDSSESSALVASFVMILFGFPLIAGALVYTLIRLCYVYPEKRWKAFLIFLSYVLGPLSVGILGWYVVNLVQIHLLTFLVMILMILVSYLPPLYLHYTKRNQ